MYTTQRVWGKVYTHEIIRAIIMNLLIFKDPLVPFGHLYKCLSLPFSPSHEFEGNSEDRELQHYKDTDLLS